jgi:hypothetical protein
VTTGLKCPPETCPPAKIITIKAEPIARGGITPGALGITVPDRQDKEEGPDELGQVLRHAASTIPSIARRSSRQLQHAVAQRSS